MPSETRAPLVSILTPSYQQGRFLPDCLLSVARQSYPHVEHVVVDGGSTDGTLEVLQAAETVDWTSGPDGGQSDAVNTGWARSGGEIVGWINSDDGLFAVDTLARVVAAFAQHPEADVIYGDAALAGEDGLVLRHHSARWRDSGPLPLISPLAQPAVFLRRSALPPGEPVLRADLHRRLDYELWLRLRSRGARFVHLPAVLAVDRDHAERKVRADDGLFVEETEQLVREYGGVFEAPRLGRAGSVARRALGLGAVLTLEQRYEPAFPWHVDGRLRRALRQVAQAHPVQLTERERRLARAGR